MRSGNRHPSHDRIVEQIVEALARYKARHAKASVEVKRQNSVSVRIRIIDPDYQRMDRVDRDTHAWEFLDDLPDETKADITMLLLLTPKEAKTSLANAEFEDPIPSRL
ncbi:MAG TPA: hypothetical protein VND64_25625 [Pirellulales bacterium]|nr:hypothetical protein [Pirellulales bacterium]